MPNITTNLWFDGNGEEAAEFYCSVFPNSTITGIARYTDAGPGEPGTAMTVDFTLHGTRFTAINGGPQFTFTEAISLLIECADQDEVDHYWDALIEDDQTGQCGWVKDRLGLSWQVVPQGMEEVLGDPDPERANRAMTAMLGMGKLDVAALRAAADAA